MQWGNKLYNYDCVHIVSVDFFDISKIFVRTNCYRSQNPPKLTSDSYSGSSGWGQIAVFWTRETMAERLDIDLHDCVCVFTRFSFCSFCHFLTSSKYDYLLSALLLRTIQRINQTIISMSTIKHWILLKLILISSDY